MVTDDMRAAALVAMARKNTPTDIQGSLLRGCPRENWQPGALDAAIEAVVKMERARCARLASHPVLTRSECCRDTADAIAAAIEDGVVL